MKATLEFNLPEDSVEYQIALNAGKYLSVLVELDDWLRSEIKYNEILSDAEKHQIERARKILLQGIEEENINIHI